MTRPALRRWTRPTLAAALLLAGCAAPPLVEQDAAVRAVDQARFLGGAEVDPQDWGLAVAHLSEGEQLVEQREYDEAVDAFARAEFFAGRTILSVYEQLEAAEAASKAPPSEETPGTGPLPDGARPATTPPPAPIPPLVSYDVKPGETLWTIAARRRVYGDALLWPLIYKANRDQIKDPRQIYPNQTLTIPRGVSEQEREAAREMARRSEVFSLQPPPPDDKKVLPVR